MGQASAPGQQAGEVPGGVLEVDEAHVLVGAVGEVAADEADARRHYRHPLFGEQVHRRGTVAQRRDHRPPPVHLLGGLRAEPDHLGVATDVLQRRDVGSSAERATARHQTLWLNQVFN
jgi:hypothetical protein